MGLSVGSNSENLAKRRHFDNVYEILKKSDRMSNFGGWKNLDALAKELSIGVELTISGRRCRNSRSSLAARRGPQISTFHQKVHLSSFTLGFMANGREQLSNLISSSNIGNISKLLDFS